MPDELSDVLVEESETDTDEEEPAGRRDTTQEEEEEDDREEDELLNLIDINETDKLVYKFLLTKSKEWKMCVHVIKSLHKHYIVWSVCTNELDTDLR